MRRPLLILAMTAAVTASLPAQDTPKPANADVAGAWDVSFTSPQGSATWRVNLQQAGDTLHGTAATDFGTLTLYDGWIEGNNIWFSMSLSFNGQNLALAFEGTVKDDALSGTISLPGIDIQPFAFSGARAKGGEGPLASP